MRKLVPIVTAAVALALGLAPAASAATTCEVDTGQVLKVDMTTTNSNALVAVGPSGDIQLRGTGPVLTCANAQPTLATISTILVVDDSDDATSPPRTTATTRFRSSTRPCSYTAPRRSAG